MAIENNEYYPPVDYRKGETELASIEKLVFEIIRSVGSDEDYNLTKVSESKKEIRKLSDYLRLIVTNDERWKKYADYFTYDFHPVLYPYLIIIIDYVLFKYGNLESTKAIIDSIEKSQKIIRWDRDEYLEIIRDIYKPVIENAYLYNLYKKEKMKDWFVLTPNNRDLLKQLQILILESIRNSLFLEKKILAYLVIRRLGIKFDYIDEKIMMYKEEINKKIKYLYSIPDDIKDELIENLWIFDIEKPEEMKIFSYIENVIQKEKIKAPTRGKSKYLSLINIYIKLNNWINSQISKYKILQNKRILRFIDILIIFMLFFSVIGYTKNNISLSYPLIKNVSIIVSKIIIPYTEIWVVSLTVLVIARTIKWLSLKAINYFKIKPNRKIFH